MIFGIKSFFKKGSGIDKSYKSFLLIWFSVIFVFFTISRTKLLTYIFPLFPVLAIIIGKFWNDFIKAGEENNNPGKPIIISYALLFIACFGGIIAGYLIMKPDYPTAIPPLFYSSSIFIGFVIFSCILVIKNHRYLSFISLVIGFSLLIIPTTKTILPVIGLAESSKPLAMTIMKLAKPDDPVGGESDYRRGIAYYTNRVNVSAIHEYSHIVDFFTKKEHVWGIIKRKHYNQVKEYLKNQYFEEVDSTDKFVLLTNKPVSGKK